ncbi:UPF0587 protein C1orf123 [Polychytrium aggregatum]|uniref:UPF0587 protein C1orf123 n=1 Tax=Polychytrium aggregatum TaxID=110093 RepID=UPI0022FE12F0|nr:UPF0587 protein C1orf123 [Polychytrium aggregatum]KAI9203239.1 UPF0587 protein C1orf123 [Polychytrium aggregatum]
MPKYNLQFKADVENLTDIKPAGDDYEWLLKIKCTSCSEVNPALVTVVESESHPIPNSRGEANLVMKCKFCKTDGSGSLVSKSIKPYNLEHSGNFSTVATFELRNLEVVGWKPSVGFRAIGAESETVFEDIDLQDDWTEYDEKAQESVSILNIETKASKC